MNLSPLIQQAMQRRMSGEGEVPQLDQQSGMAPSANQPQMPQAMPAPQGSGMSMPPAPKPQEAMGSPIDMERNMLTKALIKQMNNLTKASTGAGTQVGSSQGV
jgi:hypothetical protein